MKINLHKANEMFRLRLLHTSIAVMWRRFKITLIYLCSLIVLYILVKWLTCQNVEQKPKSSVYLRHVTVHFDLKGSPPKLAYLTYYLPILNMYGVNTILMEYEDMFPYTGNLINISSVNAYKKNELLKFISKARQLDMEVIPLIQTFGHMEFVLKLKEFAYLRELVRYPADICPSNPGSLALITEMLKQVIDLHSTDTPLRHIHIGCDEVRKINKCLVCIDRKLKDSAMFVQHVEEVASIVKEITPFTKILIWGDMLHQIDMPKIFINNTNIEPVEWDYSAKPNFSHKHFYNLHKNFKNIWIASAYKGADGRAATAPNIKKRFQNHLSWMKFILDYKFGGEKKVYHFEGIILTGWSRYSHMAPQCELLPISMPSLILNLLLIKSLQEGIDHGDLDNLNDCEFFHKYLSLQFREIFESSDDTETRCAFENTLIEKEHNEVFDSSDLNDCFTKLRNQEFECQRQAPHTDIINLEYTNQKCREALLKLASMKTSIEIFMAKYYKLFVIKSYIDEVIQVPAKKIKTIMDYLHNCTGNRVWGRRY